jgi:hypothetical protein
MVLSVDMFVVTAGATVESGEGDLDLMQCIAVLFTHLPTQ